MITAITLLETELRKRLEIQGESYSRSPSVGQIVKQAATAHLIDWNQAELVQRWMAIRNTAIHTAKQPSREDATLVVEGVHEILAALNDPHN